MFRTVRRELPKKRRTISIFGRSVPLGLIMLLLAVCAVGAALYWTTALPRTDGMTTATAQEVVLDGVVGCVMAEGVIVVPGSDCQAAIAAGEPVLNPFFWDEDDSAVFTYLYDAAPGNSQPVYVGHFVLNPTYGAYFELLGEPNCGDVIAPSADDIVVAWELGLANGLGLGTPIPAGTIGTVDFPFAPDGLCLP